jgi:hypothetical protein
MSAFRSAIFATALVLAPVLLAADARANDSDLEQVLIETASTPQQHQALANHFRAKAAQERKEAALHRQMGKAYSGGRATIAQSQSQHCAKIAEMKEASAAEYEKLAEAPEAEANNKSRCGAARPARAALRRVTGVEDRRCSVL